MEKGLVIIIKHEQGRYHVKYYIEQRLKHQTKCVQIYLHKRDLEDSKHRKICLNRSFLSVYARAKKNKHNSKLKLLILNGLNFTIRFSGHITFRYLKRKIC